MAVGAGRVKFIKDFLLLDKHATKWQKSQGN